MSWLTLVGAVVVAVLLAALAAIGGALYANRTPLLEPPGVIERLGLYFRTNVAQTDANPRLAELSSIVVVGDINVTLNAIADAGRELGWREVVVDEAGKQIRAVVVSSLFGYKDDVEVRAVVRDAQHTEAVVRSASRVGRGDLGANAHHIMMFRENLRARGLLAEEGS